MTGVMVQEGNQKSRRRRKQTIGRGLRHKKFVQRLKRRYKVRGPILRENILRENILRKYIIQEYTSTNAKRYDMKGYPDYDLVTFTASANWTDATAMAIITRRDIADAITTERIEDQSVLIKISGTNLIKKLLLIYAPADRTKRNQWCDSIRGIIERNTPDIILGDLNEYPNPTLDYHCLNQNIVTYPTIQETKLINILTDIGYADTFRSMHPTLRKFTSIHHFKSPNRITSTRINHIFTLAHRIEHIYNCDIHKDKNFHSDHHLITVEFQIETNPHPPHTEALRHPTCRQPRTLWKKYSKYLEKHHGTDEMNWCDDINTIEQKLRMDIQEAINCTFPIKEERRTKRYKLTKKERELMRDHDNLDRIYRMIDTDEPLSFKDIQTRTILQSKYRSISNDQGGKTERLLNINNIRRKIRIRLQRDKRTEKNKSIRKSIDKLFKTIGNDRNALYRIIATTSQRNDITAVTIDDEIISKPTTVKKEVADKWKPIFTSGRQIERIQMDDQPNTIGSGITRMITEDDLDKTLKNLRKDKSPGIDDIPNEALQFLPIQMKRNLLHMMNLILNQKKLPDIWKHSPVSLIYKDGQKTNPLNYRPISLLCTSYKVLSRIINERLNDVIRTHHLIQPDQHGFQRGKGTHHSIAEHLACIEDSLAHNKDLYVIYLDLKKAYDSVEHNVLLNTLYRYKFDRSAIDIIQMLLKDNVLQFKTAHGLSDEIKVSRGVRQGDVISPTLFLLFINPLIKRLNEANLGYQLTETRRKNCTFYADDGTVYADTEEDLHKSFEIVQRFSLETNIDINPTKSSVAWNTERPIQPIYVQPGNNKMNEIGKHIPYQYLGMTVNLAAEWSTQEKELENKYKRTVHSILQRKWLGTNIHTRLINTIAQPIITYRMQGYPMNHDFVEGLDQFTTRALQQNSNISKGSGPDFWFLYRGLNSLAHLNIAVSTNTITNLYQSLDLTQFIPNAIEQMNKLLSPLDLRIVNTHQQDAISPEIFPNSRNLIKSINARRINHETEMNIQNLTQLIGSNDARSFIEQKFVSHHRRSEESRQRTMKEMDDFVQILQQPIWQHTPIEYIPRTELQPEEVFHHRGKVWMFTDGSIRENKGYAAVFIKDGSPHNTAFAISGVQDSLNAELNGLQTALEMFPLYFPGLIFTDSLNSIHLMNKWNHMTINQKNRSQYRVVMERLMKRYTQLNQFTTVTVTFVYAHTLDTPNSLRISVQRTKKRRTMREKFGENTDLILKGNQAANKLVASIHVDTSPIMPINSDMPSILLLHKQGGVWTTNTRKDLLQRLRDKLKQSWSS
ncbi:hypothetical protein PROFUN_12589 [Planoprotostelium fungivorum]|uniref:Reverse transcriptase domain-containing protein n=1 Tax=Planoprotostelium fungivorum TaxID=1890364 RepID=A0A2P6N6A2_9EUKA|nr:hypothetical protein PROFUN_12589 [Planoprotostelium fungivorum]